MENRAKAGVIVASLMFSTAAPLIRGTGGGVDMLTVAFYRMFFATAAWLPFYLLKRRQYKNKIETGKKERIYIISAGILLGLHFAAWTSSLAFTTVASATFIILSQPLMAAVAAHFILHEKLNKWNIFAILLTLIGAFFIFRGDLQLGYDYLIGDILAFLGAIASTAYIFIARIIRRVKSEKKDESLPLALYLTPVYAISCFVLFVFNFFYDVDLFHFESKIWVIFILLGLIPTFIGHSLFNWATKYLPAFSVNVAVVGEPIGASILVFLIFGEVPSAGLLIGAPIMLFAVFLVLKYPPRS